MILRSSELAMIGAIFQLRFVFFSDRCPLLRCGGMVMIESFVVWFSVGRNQIILEYRRTRDWLYVLLQTTVYLLLRVSAIEFITLHHGKLIIS